MNMPTLGEIMFNSKEQGRAQSIANNTKSAEIQLNARGGPVDISMADIDTYSGRTAQVDRFMKKPLDFSKQEIDYISGQGNIAFPERFGNRVGMEQTLKLFLELGDNDPKKGQIKFKAISAAGI